MCNICNVHFVVQRLFVEMEQMASRPFSQVLVEIELREKAELCSNANPATLRKRKKVVLLYCVFRPWNKGSH
jgi:hypothetical protein